MRTLSRSSLAGLLVLALASVGSPALAQPGKDAPENPRQPDAPAAQPAPAAPSESKKESALVYVTLNTSKGDIVLELNREKAPITVENFVKYVESGHYNGTIFHRVIDGFMIQGGGMDKDMKEKATGSPIKNEWQNGLKNARGTIAMARTNKPDSATAQFFINVKDNDNLDKPISGGAGYAVFGKVVGGMDVVDAIKAVQTKTVAPHANVPVEPIVITTAKVITEDEAKKAAK